VCTGCHQKLASTFGQAVIAHELSKNLQTIVFHSVLKEEALGADPLGA
jgi:hypothetical protein